MWYWARQRTIKLQNSRHPLHPSGRASRHDIGTPDWNTMTPEH
jgi:hypothetical protein